MCVSVLYSVCVCVQTAELENQMVSVERIVEYTTLQVRLWCQ